MGYLCYVLVNKNGNMITTDSKLPLYWNRYVAKDESKKFKAEIRELNINDLKGLLKKIV